MTHSARRAFLPRSTDLADRRAFLSSVAHRALGVGGMPWLVALAAQDPARRPRPQDATAPALRPATARSVIYLYMSGGMSHLDTFDPKPGSAGQGPTETIDTNVAGVRIASHFTNLARLMDRVCVVSGMNTTQGAHAQGRYYLHTSYEMRGTVRHPSMGAWASRMAGAIHPSLPPHVTIGGDIFSASGGFLETAHHPLPIGDPEAGLQHSRPPRDVSDETFHRRLARLQQMNDRFAAQYRSKAVRSYAEVYDQAVRLMQSRDLRAFELAEEDERTRDAYGRDRFGQGCLLARRLVEHGVRFVEVVDDGWDTHNDNFETLEEKAPALDRALASLLLDLEARGLLDETLVVLATEFGRTPKIAAGRDGRDHHPQAYSCLLAGGGVRGGQRYGETDATGSAVIDGRVSVPDFNATIAHALGLRTDWVLLSGDGRPFQVAHKGIPVPGLLA